MQHGGPQLPEMLLHRKGKLVDLITTPQPSHVFDRLGLFAMPRGLSIFTGLLCYISATEADDDAAPVCERYSPWLDGHFMQLTHEDYVALADGRPLFDVNAWLYFD
jgi:hypothetical protein